MLLNEGPCEREFSGDLSYKFRKIVCKINFSKQFIKVVTCYKKIGYNMDTLRQIACMVVNQIMVG